MLHLGEQLVSELDAKHVLALVADAACEVIHAETLVVPLIDFDQHTFTYAAASGEYANLVLGHVFPIEEGHAAGCSSINAPCYLAKEACMTRI